MSSQPDDPADHRPAGDAGVAGGAGRADPGPVAPGAGGGEAASLPPGFKPWRMGEGFIGANGPLYAAGKGEAFKLGFRVEPRHCNPMGICHGGMLATFCDMLIPLSVHHMRDDVGRRFLPTVSLQLDYLATAPLGAWVEGRCQVLRVTRSLVFAQGLVTADGEAAVRCSGVFKIGPAFGDAARGATRP